MRLGILGGGQLGRMLAMAAHRLGAHPLVLDPKPDCSAAAVAPTLTAAWDDPSALDRLARCDVVTYEFENAPPAAVKGLAERVAVRPGPDALLHTGDRLLEKRMLRRLGLSTARFCAIDTESDLRAAVAELGLPAVLKTRRLGYDGRGQRVLHRPEDLGPAWRELGARELILEEFVDFEREVSLIAVRSREGSIHFWAPTENRHVDGILRISRAPAPGVGRGELRLPEAQVAALLEHLDYVGVLVVEFFVRDGRWIANEVACRVHNSGHWTLEGAVTSQFENHVRAVTGLPLGSTRCIEPCAMVNLIGRMPPAGRLLSVAGARLHAYGKSGAPGRKLGHVTLSGAEWAETERQLAALLDRLDDPQLHEANGAPRR